ARARLHAAADVAAEVALLEDAGTLLVDVDAELVAVADAAAADDRVAAAADEHTGLAVAADGAVLDGAAAAVAHRDAAPPAVVDAAAADGRVGLRPVDADARPRVGGDGTVLQQQFPLRNLHAELGVALARPGAAQRQASHHRVARPHGQAVGVAAG